MRSKLNGLESLRKRQLRFTYKGKIGPHIGRFQNKYIMMQKSENKVDIYREDFSNEDVYQQLTIEGTLNCSSEF